MSPIQPKTLFRAEIAYVYSVHTTPPPPWVCALQAQTQMKPMNSFDNENIRPHKFF